MPAANAPVPIVVVLTPSTVSPPNSKSTPCSKSAVKITTFVQSADDFHEQPAVANGGTQLLLELWGEEAGLPSRSAIGVNALPGNIPVETEALFEVDTVSP